MKIKLPNLIILRTLGLRVDIQKHRIHQIMTSY